MIVTADHGNAEQMIDPVTGGPHTAHTLNPVPLIFVGETANQLTLRTDGALQDISPTVLAVLGIPQPKEMSGHDLRVAKSGK
jgi:2,3-bisphosphoglycerate-independent phosphoglycerate mutase